MEKSKEELFLKLGEILAREKQIKETEKTLETETENSEE